MKEDRKNKGNVPNLRFPQFAGEWEMIKLGEILKVGSGRDYKHLKEGNIPVFGTGGYMTSVNEFLFDGESVCIGRKGTINKPFYYNGKFWTVDTLFYTYSYKNVLPKFIFNVFEQINWLMYNEASGVPSLSKSTIEQIEISIPDISEQAKIASFLTLIEERISAQSKIIEGLKELKASLSKQVFSCKLRFKDENDRDFPEWKNITLSDVVERITQKNNVLNTNVLTISAQMGLVNQLIYYKKNIASKDLSNYYVLSNGDFAYNKSYSTGYPFGAFKRLDKYPSGIVSPLYICFRSKNNIDSNFLVQYFEAGKMNDEIQSIAREGARNHGLLNVGITDFFSLYIEYPSISEQQKIASVLSAIDDKIETEEKILERYTVQKKFLLKQMFI